MSTKQLNNLSNQITEHKQNNAMSTEIQVLTWDMYKMSEFAN
jgi:hypothetical protein